VIKYLYLPLWRSDSVPLECCWPNFTAEHAEYAENFKIREKLGDRAVFARLSGLCGKKLHNTNQQHLTGTQPEEPT
jgi:hypothetical protein